MALLSAAILGVLGAPSPDALAEIRPRVRAGPRLTRPCEVRALREDAERVGPVEAGLRVPPGAWWLVLACPDPSDRTVLVPGPRIQAEAGDVLHPEIQASAAPLRVDAIRDGAPIQAQVSLRIPGLPRDLLELPARTTTWVGRGDWRVRVHTETAERELAVSRWRRGRKTTVLEADLSDGSVRVRARVNGKPAKAIVRRVRPDGELGPARRAEIDLPPGEHRLQVILAEAADAQARVRPVRVEPGETRRLDVAFEAGWLDVQVKRDGRQLEVPVQLAKPGAGKSFGFVDSPGRALLRPGRVRLWTEGGHAGPSGRHDLGAVEIRAGRVTKVRVDLTPPVIEAELKGGDAEVVLREAGGGAVVPPERPGRWRPWAGRYELVVRRPGAAPAIDGPFEARLGERVTRVVELDTLQVRLRALRAGAEVSGAKLWVYRAGAGEPLTSVATGGVVTLVPGRYDVRARAGPRHRWRRGLELRASTTVDVVLPAAGDGAPSADVALPEGDAP